MASILPYTDENLSYARAMPDQSLVWIDSPNRIVVFGAEEKPSGALVVTAEEFRDRFLAAEIAAVAASISDPEVSYFVLVLCSAQAPFRLDDPRVVAGVAKLVEKGILSPQRAECILA